MSRTLPALLRLGNAPRSRFALATVLGALTVIFGVGLMAMAGYLISRSAERPPVLSLMVAIVVVRFFGLGRPIIRYLERLASHDLALRVLGRVRVSFYERIEPLAPAQLDCYRSGDLLSRMVADVDALQNLYLRGLGPPLVALLAGAVCVGVAAAFAPAAGLLLALGLIAGGLAVPAGSGALGARAGRRQATARGELSAEVLELIRGAPELVAFGADRARLEGMRAADDRSRGATPSPPAWATASALWSPASRSPACSRSRSTRRQMGGLAACSSPCSRCSSWHRSRPSPRSAKPPARSPPRSPPVNESSSSQPKTPRCTTPLIQRRPRTGPSRSRSKTYAPRTPASDVPPSTASRLPSSPARRLRSSAPAAPARPRSRTCSCASSTPSTDG